MKLLLSIGLFSLLLSAADPKKDFQNFKSPDSAVRSAAFYDLTEVGCPHCAHSDFPVIDGLQNAIAMGAVSKDSLVDQLTSLLNTESKVYYTSGSLTEEYSDYVGDLVQAVSFFGDKRSVSVLFAFVSSGNMAANALAALGDPSLALVSHSLVDPTTDPLTRLALYSVLRKMTLKKNPDRFDNVEVSRATIKSALKQGLSETNFFSRIEAVNGLAELGDPDVMPLLQNLYSHDTYSDSPQGVLQYPVREAAQKALDKLASTNKFQ